MFINKIRLRIKQKRIDKQYKKEGLSDDVFTKQAEVNRLRHELNIPDEKHYVYEKFVQ